MTATYPTTSRFSPAGNGLQASRSQMTDADLERLRADVPDSPVRLQAGWLACTSCGRVTEEPADSGDIIVVVSRGRMLSEDDTLGNLAKAHQARLGVGADFGTRMTLCDDCRDRQALAASLAHQVRGQGSYAAERTRAALDALALVGRLSLAGTTDPTTLVNAMWQSGVSLAWRSRFEPAALADADSDSASPRPWAHVMMGARLRARKALNDLERLLAAQAATAAGLEDVTIECPPALAAADGYPTLAQTMLIEGGCLVCGRTSVTVSAAAVAGRGLAEVTGAAWRPAHLTPAALGGNGPGRVLGHVCGTCAEAQAVSRAWGTLTVTRALVTALCPDLARRAAVAEVRVPGLAGFGAAVARARRRGEQEPIATAAPWGWLPDRDDLTSDLRRLLGRG